VALFYILNNQSRLTKYNEKKMQNVKKLSGVSNIVTRNSTLTVGLLYRSPNISTDENDQVQNATKEVSKRDCVIMGNFNHGRIQWKSLVLGVRIKSF